MKSILLFLVAFSSNTFLSVYAQSGIGISEKENWLEYWTEFDPKKKEYREAKKVLTG